jgi:hypothetical protein
MATCILCRPLGSWMALEMGLAGGCGCCVGIDLLSLLRASRLRGQSGAGQCFLAPRGLVPTRDFLARSPVHPQRCLEATGGPQARGPCCTWTLCLGLLVTQPHGSSVLSAVMGQSRRAANKPDAAEVTVSPGPQTEAGTPVPATGHLLFKVPGFHPPSSTAGHGERT